MSYVVQIQMYCNYHVERFFPGPAAEMGQMTQSEIYKENYHFQLESEKEHHKI